MVQVMMDILTPFWMEKKDGVFVLGLREVGGADAQTQLYLFKEVLDEIEVNQKQRICYQSCYKYPQFGGTDVWHKKNWNFYKI